MADVIRHIIYLPLFNALIFLTWLVPGNSVGWAIVILTVLIRLLLLPSSNRAMREQQRMRELAPHMEKIKEKHKDDKEAQARATMELYKTHKVSPMGSCLPMLVQLPLLMALFYVFRNGLNTSHFDQLYSFIPRPENIKTFFFGVNLAHPDHFFWPFLAGGLQFLQSRQLAKLQGAPRAKEGQDNMQKMLTSQMTYIMPAMTTMISFSLPAALPLYWSVTTLFAVGQQEWLRRRPLASAVVVSVKNKE